MGFRSEKEPLKTVSIPGFANLNMDYLYQSEGIFNKFQVSASANSSSFITGNYNGEFVIVNWETGEQHKFTANSSRWPKDLLQMETCIVGGGFHARQDTIETGSSFVNVDNPAIVPLMKSRVHFTNFHPKDELLFSLGRTVRKKRMNWWFEDIGVLPHQVQ